MFENEMQTRCAICGTGVLLGGVLVLAHLPLILLIIPIAILFLGLVADPMETHAAWYGMLNTIGIFDLSALTDEERENYAEKKHYFWFGEVATAAVLAGIIAFPLGLWLARQADPAVAFTGAALLFLILFVFLPKIVRHGMREDTDAAIDAFGKNEHVRKVFWAAFVAVAGLVLARIVDPATALEIGTGDNRLNPFFYLRTGNVKVLVVGPGGKTSGTRAPASLTFPSSPVQPPALPHGDSPHPRAYRGNHMAMAVHHGLPPRFAHIEPDVVAVRLFPVSLLKFLSRAGPRWLWGGAPTSVL